MSLAQRWCGLTGPDGGRSIASRYDSAEVQTRYLIAAAFATGLVILVAAAAWFAQF